MNKELTKKQALEDCIELWQAISEECYNLTRSYEDWEIFKQLVTKQLKMDHYENDCPCCEYVKQMSGYDKINCDNCPVWSQSYPCFSAEYGDFVEALTINEAQHAADSVVVAVEEELEKWEILHRNYQGEKMNFTEELMEQVRHIKQQERIKNMPEYELTTLYLSSKLARDEIKCITCGKTFHKKTSSQVFCCHKGQFNCKDAFWNAIKGRTVAKRLKQITG